MNRISTCLCGLVLLLNFACSNKEMTDYAASSDHIRWHGRTVQDLKGNRQLIGSASGMEIRFEGDLCRIWLQNMAPAHGYNYISIVLDGIHQDRKAIHYDTFTPMEIKVEKKASIHTLELYKETEAVCGLIAISRIDADSLLAIPESTRKKIEFIGNSITVGMSADTSLVPCSGGAWYDQHNAYDAYGPCTARSLDLDYMITGVSGIGIYRNWNTDGPTIGSVCDQMYMNANPMDIQWDYKKFVPDIVTICLGTNDVSEGDGVTARLPFDTVRFINAYVTFIEKLHTHYPDARFILLNTPLVGEANIQMLTSCLNSVKKKAESSIMHLKPVSVFTFSMLSGAGCGGHPDPAQHKRMADELIPVIKNLL